MCGFINNVDRSACDTEHRFAMIEPIVPIRVQNCAGNRVKVFGWLSRSFC